MSWPSLDRRSSARRFAFGSSAALSAHPALRNLIPADLASGVVAIREHVRSGM